MNLMLRTAAEHVLGLMPRRTGSGAALILAYHNIVVERDQPQGDASLHLPVDAFDRQLRRIAQEADVVPLGTLLDERFRRGPESLSVKRSRLVAITFDDAYAGALRLGLTCCSANRMAATVFVTPGLLGTVPPWDLLADQGEWTASRRQRFLWEEDGRSPLSSPPLARDVPEALSIATEAELMASFTDDRHTVGNHTFDHANLGALDLRAATDQLARAHAWLGSRFSARYLPVVTYPYGIPPRDPKSTLSAASLSAGLAVTGGWMGGAAQIDPLSVPRWNVPAGISDRGFRLRMRGWMSNR